MSASTQRGGPSPSPASQQQQQPGWSSTMDPLHGSQRPPSSSGGYGVGNRWLPESPSMSYPTTNLEARELYKSEQSAAGLNWKRDICTLMTRIATGFDGALLLVVSFIYMLANEMVVGNWFGSMHNVPPSARDICSALVQSAGGLIFMCACLLLAAAPFVTARHAPWLAFAHWIATLSISKNIFDSSASDLGVDRWIVASTTCLHLFPALCFSFLTIANAITREDPMMIAPWKSLQRGKSPANMVFFGLGCFYLLWSLSWMIFPSYTVKRSIYDRLSYTPLKYAAQTEYAVAGPFFFLGLLHIAFSGLASMTRELPLAAAFGHALNIGLDSVSWFSGGAMNAASFRPSILYGALFLHLFLAFAHSVLAYSVQPHTGFMQMAQETANVIQQNIQQTMQEQQGLGGTIKQTLGVGGAGQPPITEQISEGFQKVKEAMMPSDTPAGYPTEKPAQYLGAAKETGQSYAEKAKETVQQQTEKAKEAARSAMHQTTQKPYEEQFTTPSTSGTAPKPSLKATERGGIETKTTQQTTST